MKSAWEQPVFSDKDIKIINQEDIREKVWQLSIKSSGKPLKGKRRIINCLYNMKVAASILVFTVTLISVYFYIQKPRK